MADITMCPGGDCPLKKACYRYTAVPSGMQSMMAKPIFVKEDTSKKLECRMYWPNGKDAINIYD